MKRIWLPLALLAAFTLPVFAQEPEPEEEDAAGRGVARISLINGEVSVRRGDSGDWTAAAQNAPMVAGDQLFTGPNSRAELQFDYANMMRLSANAEVHIGELENRRYTVQVARGTILFRVLRDADGAEVEIATPTVAARPMRQGAYRIEVREDGTTEITVRDGEAEIYASRGVQRLTAGRTMIARGDPSDPEFQMVAAVREDEFDQWNRRRDDQLERSESYQHVSRDIYGAEDLDGNGRWVNVAPYGSVWQPTVAADWAPYRSGRWSWVDYYGWTWVSYDPWGWAPYHYGRWFNQPGYGWCWYPGGVRSRHYWRPALVSFFGWGGGGVSVGVGFGRVGWVPLAPYETYRPWYGRRNYGGGRVQNFAVVNNVNIVNTYRNARVRNGYTVVDGHDFSRGRVNALRNFGDNDLRQASSVRGRLPIVPERDSLRLADREPRRFTANNSGRFVSRRGSAAPAQRVSFEEQRRGFEQGMRRGVGDASSRAVPGDVPRSPAGNNDRGGWRRFGEPVRASEAQRAGSGRTAEAGGSGEGWRRTSEPRAADQSTAPSNDRSNDSGWRRFGEPVRSTTQAPRAERDPRNDRANQPNAERAPENRGNWRRFGDAPSDRGPDGGFSRRIDSAQPPPQPPAEGRRDRRAEPRSEPRQAEPRPEAQPQQQPERRFGGEQRRREEPVRISPPIVRERRQQSGNGSTSQFGGSRDRSSGGGRRMESAPSGGSGGGRFGGGGGGGNPRGNSGSQGGRARR